MTLRVHPDDIVAARPVGALAVHPSWTRVRLASIATVLNGFAFPSAGFGPHGDMPLLRIRDVGRLATDTRYSGDFDPTYLVEPGSLVVGMDGDFRVDHWSGPPALLNQRVCKIAVRNCDHYDDRFLRWVLPAYLDAVHQHTSSITVKHLSSETLKELPLPLPPRAEQERIVAAIEEQFSRLDAGAAALESARRKVKRMRAAVLEAAVGGRLVPQDAADEPADRWLTAHGKAITGTARGDQPPNGWTRTTVGELKSWSLYGPRFSSSEYVVDGIPVLRTTDITSSGRILVNQAPKLALSSSDLNKYRVEQGDILITRTGSIGTVAFVADDRPAIPGAYLILYRFGLPTEFAEFLFFLFQSPHVQAQLVRKSVGIGRPNLNAPSIDRIVVDVPPFAELRRIVSEVRRHLSLIEFLDSLFGIQEGRSQALRSSIFASAFAGKLVPQDNKDEPASVLLDRIAAERAASNGRASAAPRRPHTQRPRIRV